MNQKRRGIPLRPHEPTGALPGTGGSGRRWLGRPSTPQAVVIVVAYLAFYLLVGWAIGLLARHRIVEGDVLATVGSIFFALVLPIGIGALSLVGFTRAAGWTRSVFGRRRDRGPRWMWLAPALVCLAILGHAGATEWSAWSAGQIAALALAGLCIGLAEELLTRGLVVKVLRDARHSERYVMIGSALLFALLHLSNLISGMKPGTVAATVVYTFGFGTCMYLTMRVTGTLWAAIALHALTDPTTFLATGGVDEAVASQSSGMWSLLTVGSTLGMIVLTFVAVFLVKGRRPLPPAV
ncbi:CPBP family intramembrane glutamic endopeptidase [Streptomyces sp. NPDC047141]|uniref:CPBP family intramembrane glutamic endopeptidase n=1 Tax=Streptomyces sp. NPDC047141 TaxID=3155738 RepID=UPI0033D3088C